MVLKFLINGWKLYLFHIVTQVIFAESWGEKKAKRLESFLLVGTSWLASASSLDTHFTY